MNDFNPGEGWRESDGIPDGVEGLMRFPADGGQRQTWVREASVPPLPTAPYTVIRVTWDPRDAVRVPLDVLTLVDDRWTCREATWTVHAVSSSITGFEVLAYPVSSWSSDDYTEKVRRETAKAVLDRVRDAIPHSGTEQMEPRLDAIAQAFEVEP